MATAFDPKDPRETNFFTFNFSSLLATNETLVSVVVTIVKTTGAKAHLNPSDMLVSFPSISGPRVQQLVTGGFNGNVYHIRAEATTSIGEVYVIGSNLSVTLK